MIMSGCQTTRKGTDRSMGKNECSEGGRTYRGNRLLLVLLILALFLLPSAALAVESDSLDEIRGAVDTIWVLFAAFLVFFMQAGFAMVETGFTRAKNAGNIIMKNFIDFCVGSLAFWFIGFTLMFGFSIRGFIGSGALAFSGDYAYLGLNIPPYAFLLFQTVFAATGSDHRRGSMAFLSRSGHPNLRSVLHLSCNTLHARLNLGYYYTLTLIEDYGSGTRKGRRAIPRASAEEI